MRALVNSNPTGLCIFDVFMIHAVAVAPVDQTVDPEFTSFIDQEYDSLMVQAQETLADPRFAGILASALFPVVSANSAALLPHYLRRCLRGR